MKWKYCAKSLKNRTYRKKIESNKICTIFKICREYEQDNPVVFSERERETMRQIVALFRSRTTEVGNMDEVQVDCGRQLEIPSEFDRLAYEINAATALLETLSKRLEPITTPVPVETVEGPEELRAVTPMGQRTNILQVQMYRLNNQMRRLLESLEL